MKAIKLQVQKRANDISIVLAFKVKIKGIKFDQGSYNNVKCRHERYVLEFASDADGVDIAEKFEMNKLSKHENIATAYEDDESIKTIIEDIINIRSVKHGHIKSDYRDRVVGWCTFNIIESEAGQYRLWSITPDNQPSRSKRRTGFKTFGQM